MDKGTFYTHALARLGDHNDIAGSDEHAACEMFAQHALEVCMDYSSWSWATVQAVLLCEDAGRVTLPPDCLRLVRVEADAYELFGRTLMLPPGVEQVRVCYVSSTFIDAVALPDYEPTFCEACILMLAAMMAPRLTNNLNLAASLKQEAYAKLHAAKVKDARQTDSNDQTPEL